jgi:hypothetical protein
MTGNFATRSLATAIKLAVATGLVALLVLSGCGIRPEVKYQPQNVAPSSFVPSSEPNWQRIQLKNDLTVAEAWKRIKAVVPTHMEIKDIDYCLVTDQSLRSDNGDLYYRVRIIIMLIPETNSLRFKVNAQFYDKANGDWINGYWIRGYDTAALKAVAKDLQSAIGE